MKLFQKSVSILLVILIFLGSFNLTGLFKGNLIDNAVHAVSVPSQAVWIPRDSGTTQNINDIVYGNGMFVAVGNGGIILTSVDGVSWISQSSGITTNLNKIIYSGSLFVTIGAAGAILSSQDGITWNKGSSGTGNALNAIAYGDSTYMIVVHPTESTPFILRSNDGTKWTKQFVNGYNGNIKYLNLSQAAYINGRFMIGGNYGSLIVSTNSTASVWEKKNSPDLGTIGEAVYGNGFMIAPLFSRPSEFMISEDNGDNFTHETGVGGGRVAKFIENEFYIGGNNGVINVSNTSGTSLEWTAANTPSTSATVSDLAFSGTTYYAVGSSGLIMESTDGTDWKIAESGTTNDLKRMASSGSFIAAVGSNGTILTKGLNGIEDADITYLEELLLTDTSILGENTSLESVTADLNLKTFGMYDGSVISWTSNSPDIISDAGIVKRPTYTETNPVVTLTANISYNTSTVSKTFMVVVIKSDDPNIEAVAADKAALELPLAGSDTLASVTQSLGALPKTGVNESTITWSSLAPSILSHDGQLLKRPSYPEGDTTILFIANITKGDVSDTKEFELTVKKEEVTDEAAVAADKEALTETLILNGNNALANVLTDLLLPTLGDYDSKISWTSDNSAVSSDGKVSRPDFENGNITGDLTAVISKGSVEDTIVFTIVVVKVEQTDEAAVAADKAALTLSFAEGDGVGSVTQPLALLPASGAYATKITWSSSDPETLSDDGKILKRPPFGSGDVTVDLKATISKGEKSDEIVFTLTIKENEPTDEEIVMVDLAAIDLDLILDENTSADQISHNLALPLTGKSEQTQITWSSVNSSVISDSGEVARPAYNDGNKAVTLTATVLKDDASGSRDFVFTVLKADQTNLDIVQADSQLLDESSILSGNESLMKVINDLNLPKAGRFGSTITWTSSNPSVVAIDENPDDTVYGTVVRPQSGSGNAAITLTALISKGTPKVEKKFFLTVIEQPDTAAPELVSISPADKSSGIFRLENVEMIFNEDIKLVSQNNIKISYSEKKMTWYFKTYYENVYETITIKTDENDRRKLIIDPNKVLKASTTYKVELKAGAVSDLNENTNSGRTFTFTTEALDDDGPANASSNPANGSKNAATDTVITVNFNENVYPSTAYKSIILEEATDASFFDKLLKGGSRGITVDSDISVEGKILTIRPKEVLKLGHKYNILIPDKSLEDVYGNKLGTIMTKITGGLKIVFKTTVETAPPVVVSTFPANNAGCLDNTSLLFVEFNESIIQGMDYSNIKITTDDSEPISVTTTISGNRLFIYPQSSLNSNTQYQLIVPSESITDKSGNCLLNDFILQFKTDADAPQLLAKPDNDVTDASLTETFLFVYNTTISEGSNLAGISLRDQKGSLTEVKAEVHNNGLIISSREPLIKSTEYFLTIPAGAVESNDGKTNGAVATVFKTAQPLDVGWKMFNGIPLRTLEGEDAVFDASELTELFKQSGRELLDYTWDFGGSIVNGEKVTRLYNTIGNYNVILTVSDEKGFTYSFAGEVHVELNAGLVNLEVSPEGTTTLPYTVFEHLSSDTVYKVRLSRQGIPFADQAIKVKSDLIKGYLFENAQWVPGTDEYIIEIKTDSDGYAELTLNSKGYKADSYNIEFIYEYGNVEIKQTRQYIVKQFSENSSVIVNFILPWGGNVVSHQYRDFKIDGSTCLGKQVSFNTYEISGNYPGRHEIEFTIENYYTVKREFVLMEDTVLTFELERKITSDKPVVRSVTSDLSSSRNPEDTLIFKIGAPLTFNVVIDWEGHFEGYYEVTYEDEGRELRVKKTFLKLGENEFTLSPDYKYKEGGRVKIQAVTRYGIKSAVLDAKVIFVSPPEGMSAKLVNGKYEISGMATLPGVKTPEAAKKFPFLGGHQIGLGNDNFAMEGAYEDNQISVTIKAKTEAGKTKSKNALLKNGEKKELEIAGISIEGAIGGKLIWQYNGKKAGWDFAGGGIIIEIEGKVQATQHFMVFIVPCYMRGEIGVALGTELLLIKDFDDGDFDFEGIFSVSPSLEIAIGAGGGPFFVEGYMKGGIGVEFQLPSKEYTVEAFLSGGVRATAFLFEYENEMLSYSWEIATNAKSDKAKSLMASTPMLLRAPEAGQFKLMNRDYLMEQSEWTPAAVENSGIKMFSMAAAGSGQDTPGITDELLQENVFPNTNQALLKVGNKLVMVWTADNENRSAINRTEIMCSVLENGAWSKAQFMNLDNTADLKPALAHTDDRLLMAWENMGKVLGDESSLDDMTTAMEISVAGSSIELSSWENSRNLTNDNYLDHSPRLAAGGNTAILTWIKNEGNDLFGSADKPNKIMFSGWDGAGWSEPREICEVGEAIVDSSAAYDGSRGVYTYTVDSDGDFATINDQDLYVIEYDVTGNTWGSPSKITDNDAADSEKVQDVNPVALYLDGKLFIMWYRDGKIVYTKDMGRGGYSTVPTISNANNRFTAAVSNTSQAALVYTETGNGGQNIYTTMYDSVNEVWSEKIQLTDLKSSKISAVSPAFTNDGELITVYSKADLYQKVLKDEAFNDKEYTSMGNTDLRAVTLIPKHDLSVAAESITASEESLVPGSVVTIRAVITNEGEFTERDVEVDFYDGDPLDGGVKIAGTVISGPLAPRTSAAVSVDWIVPEGTVMRDVYAVIDSRNNMYDANRGNNTAHGSLLRAELELSDMTYYQIVQSDIPDEETTYSEYKVTAKVKNIGCIPVNSAEVSLFENDANGLLVDTASVSSLEPGAVKAVEFVWDSSGKTFENDRFNLAAEVKSDGVEEYSLDNNVFYKAVKAEMLTIKRSEPSDDESDVPINSHATLEFNKSIFEGDRYSEIIFIDSKGNEVPAAKEINEFQLTLKPDAALVNGETYAVYVPVDSVNGYDGSGLRDDYSLAFTTEQLYTSPVVKFVYPADGMTDIPRDSNINIRFSGNIKVGSHYEGIVIKDDKKNIVNAKKSIQGELLSLKPTTVLGPNTAYTVVIPAGAVAYTDGTLMENDYIFSFTTDATAPDTDPDTDPDPTPAPPPSSDHPVPPVKREDGSSETVSTGLKTEDGRDIVLSKKQRELDEKVRLLAEQKGVRVMTNPVEFIAQAVAADGSKTEFEDKQTYIPREIQLEGDIDPTKATAVLYDPQTGTMVPVPTVFTKTDGKTTAIINHYGSGIYMVISSGKGFEDVQEHWAKEEIETLASKLITDGVGNDRYDPQAQLTKAQFATLIVRALGMSASKPVGQSVFSDVADQWFTDTINIAVEAGIIDESESVFRPNDAITREEIAVMIMNAVAAIGKTVKLDDVDELIGRFADYDNVKAESKDAIATLIEMGVISGNEKGEINPGDDATRAEAAAMVIRFLRYLGFMN